MATDQNKVTQFIADSIGAVTGYLTAMIITVAIIVFTPRSAARKLRAHLRGKRTRRYISPQILTATCFFIFILLDSIFGIYRASSYPHLFYALHEHLPKFTTSIPQVAMVLIYVLPPLLILLLLCRIVAHLTRRKRSTAAAELTAVLLYAVSAPLLVEAAWWYGSILFKLAERPKICVPGKMTYDAVSWILETIMPTTVGLAVALASTVFALHWINKRSLLGTMLPWRVSASNVWRSRVVTTLVSIPLLWALLTIFPNNVVLALNRLVSRAESLGERPELYATGPVFLVHTAEWGQDYLLVSLWVENRSDRALLLYPHETKFDVIHDGKTLWSSQHAENVICSDRTNWPVKLLQPHSLLAFELQYHLRKSLPLEVTDLVTTDADARYSNESPFEIALQMEFSPTRQIGNHSEDEGRRLSLRFYGFRYLVPLQRIVDLDTKFQD